MRCPKCEAKNESDAVFCENCGEKLSEIKSETKKTQTKEIKAKDKETKSKTTQKPGKPQKIAGHECGGFWIRVLARVLDGLILLIPNFIIISFLSFISSTTSAVGGTYNQGMFSGVVTIILLLVIYLLNLVYFIIMDGLGGTLGKRACGLMVINESGEDIGIGKAILRHFVYALLNIVPWLGSFVYLLGYLAIAWDPNKQGWHDKFAGSFVVYKGR